MSFVPIKIEDNKEVFYDAIGDAGKARWHINNRLIPKLESLQSDIDEKYVLLGNLKETLDKYLSDSSLVKVIEPNEFTYKYIDAWEKHLQGWLDYQKSNNWSVFSKSIDKQLKSAVYQTFQQLKKSESGQIKTLGLTLENKLSYAHRQVSYEGLLMFLSQNGILYPFDKNSFSAVPQAKKESVWGGIFAKEYDKSINGWIDYIVSKKWYPDGDNETIFRAAIYQIYSQLKSKGEIKNLGLTKNLGYSKSNFDADSFFHFLGRAGIYDNWQDYTIYDTTDIYDRQITLTWNEIQSLEKEYDATYKEAENLADKYKLAGLLSIGIWNAKNKLIKKAKNLKDAIDERYKAGKRVGKIKWWLKRYEKEDAQPLRNKITQAEARLKYYSERNKEEEQSEFDRWDKVLTQSLDKLEDVEENKISPLEKEFDELADKYDFAERRQKRFNNRIARMNYRNEKRTLRREYKEMYGKGWRKESDWRNVKTDLQMKLDERLEDTAMRGFIQKLKTGVLAPSRGAFLGLLVINAFDLTGRLAKVKEENEQAYARFLFKWYKTGGNRTELDRIIEKNKDKKAFPPFGKWANASGVNFSATGVEEVTALMAEAAPYVKMASSLLATYGTVKGITGDPEKDEEFEKDATQKFKNMVDNTDGLTDAEKTEMKSLIDAGATYLEALEKIGVDLETNPNNPEDEGGYDYGVNPMYLIGGSVLLVGVGVGLYFIFK